MLQSHIETVYPPVIDPSVVYITETADQIIKGLRGIGKPSGVFVLVDIYQNLRQLLPACEKLLRTPGSRHGDTISQLVVKIQGVITKWFSEFLTDIESQKNSKLGIPPDGTVHELTSNTLNYLKKIHDYEGIINTLLPEIHVKADSLCSAFILQCFENVLEAVDVMAKKEKEVLSEIFMFNNIHYILKTVNTSALHVILGSSHAGFVSKYEGLLNSHKKEFMQFWQRAKEAVAIEDLKNPLRKSQVKSKFKSFNSEIESLVEKQRKYSIPDQELREELRHLIIDFLVPPYSTFVTKIGDFQFSSNKGKYLRYNKDTLSAMLSQLFEGRDLQGTRKSKLLHRPHFSHKYSSQPPEQPQADSTSKKHH